MSDNESNTPILTQTDDVLEGSSIATTDHEGSDWLEEDLPDLSSVSHHHFNLEFNISCYLTILSAKVTNEIPMHCSNTLMALGLGKVDKLNDMSTVAPIALAWAV
jgi:hypothetical protein